MVDEHRHGNEEILAAVREVRDTTLMTAARLEGATKQLDSHTVLLGDIRDKISRNSERIDTHKKYHEDHFSSFDRLNQCLVKLGVNRNHGWYSVLRSRNIVYLAGFATILLLAGLYFGVINTTLIEHILTR